MRLIFLKNLSNELNDTTSSLDLLLSESRDETSTNNDGLRNGTLGQNLTVTLIISKYILVLLLLNPIAQ
jgi:hypothetical protein